MCSLLCFELFPPSPGKRLQTSAAFTFSFPFQSSSHICEQGRQKSFFFFNVLVNLRPFEAARVSPQSRRTT